MMGIFSKRPRTLVPNGILEQLNAFGTACWDATSNGRSVNDARFGWNNFYALFGPAFRTNLPQALTELHASAGDDPLARYGAYRVVAEFDAACTEPLYLDLMDNALQLKFDRGLSSGHLTGYERDRWVDTHGDVRNSFDRIVEVDPPAIDAKSGIELTPGQSLKVASQGPDPLDNQFWIERDNRDAYRAFSMRQWENDSTTLTRCEEESIGTFETVEGLLRGLGAYLRTPSYWAHPGLDPYFVERRNV